MNRKTKMRPPRMMADSVEDVDQFIANLKLIANNPALPPQVSIEAYKGALAAIKCKAALLLQQQKMEDAAHNKPTGFTPTKIAFGVQVLPDPKKVENQ